MNKGPPKSLAELVCDHVDTHWAKLQAFEALNLPDACDSCRVPVKNRLDYMLACKKCSKVLCCNGSWCTKTNIPQCCVCQNFFCESHLPGICVIPYCARRICSTCISNRIECTSAYCRNHLRCLEHIHVVKRLFVNKRSTAGIYCAACAPEYENSCIAQCNQCFEDCFITDTLPECDICHKPVCTHGLENCNHKRQKI